MRTSNQIDLKSNVTANQILPFLAKNKKEIKEIPAETQSIIDKIDKVIKKIPSILELETESLITQIDMEISFYEHRVTTTVEVYGFNNPDEDLEISSIILFGQDVAHDNNLHEAVSIFVQTNY